MTPRTQPPETRTLAYERPCETRSLISLDGVSVKVVHGHGEEEPQVLEVPGWAVQSIFRLAGRDPEEEARKIDSAIAYLQERHASERMREAYLSGKVDESGINDVPASYRRGWRDGMAEARRLASGPTPEQEPPR